MRIIHRIFIGLVLACILCFVAGAQVDSVSRRPTTVPTRSRSGQFLVVGETTLADEAVRNPIVISGGAQRSVSLTQLRPMDSWGVAQLTPALITVSSERIKAVLLRSLRLEDRFIGSIVIRILPVDARRLPARIQATQYADGWRYTVELQEKVHWTVLVRTIVEALLLEIANRGNGNQLNPIPLWLSEGVTTLLIGESSRELVPQLNREFKDPGRSMDPLVTIATKTAGRSPLGFEALAMPSEAMLTDTNQFQLFQGSSALLVHHLRSLTGGPGSLGSLVLSLNQALNWQTALLKTYEADFRSLLEVEKWWAVQSTAFYVRSASRNITVDTLDRQLQSIVQETVEVARSTNSPIGRRVLRLSETLEQWPYAAQAPVIERKMIQLRNLSMLSPRDPSPELEQRFSRMRRLVEILQPYQRERSNPGNLSRRGDVDPRIRVLVQGTVDRLRPLEREILGPR